MLGVVHRARRVPMTVIVPIAPVSDAWSGAPALRRSGAGGGSPASRPAEAVTGATAVSTPSCTSTRTWSPTFAFPSDGEDARDRAGQVAVAVVERDRVSESAVIAPPNVTVLRSPSESSTP